MGFRVGIRHVVDTGYVYKIQRGTRAYSSLVDVIAWFRDIVWTCGHIYPTLDGRHLCELWMALIF
jgi:hypothetical protein